MRTLVLSLLSMLFSISLHATRAQADSAYEQHNYIQASELYQQAIATGDTDANTFYNQGNCYYRLKLYPQAVLAYERALFRDPSFEDARKNLALTQSKLQDKFNAPTKGIFEVLLGDITSRTNLSTWGILTIIIFALGLLCASIYFLAKSPLIRKISFFVSLGFIIATLLCNIFGFARRQEMSKPRFVITTATTLYSSPATTSQQLRTLHEGTAVEVLSKSSSWIEVRLPNDQEGWLSTASGQHVN